MPLLSACSQLGCPASRRSLQDGGGRGQSGTLCSPAAPQGCGEAQSRAPCNHGEGLRGRERPGHQARQKCVDWSPEARMPDSEPHPHLVRQGWVEELWGLPFKCADGVEGGPPRDHPRLRPALLVHSHTPWRGSGAAGLPSLSHM